MKPQHEIPSPFEPRPQNAEQVSNRPAEQLPLSTNEQQGAIAIEQGSSSSGAASTQAAVQAQATPPPLPQTSAPPSGPTPSAGLGMPQIADDTDLIEKEWVEKAKDIVAQTNQDPYLQNKELNKIKVEYIKKRYNKDVKIGED